MSSPEQKTPLTQIIPPTVSEYQGYVEDWKNHIYIPQLLMGSPIFETSPFGTFTPVARCGQFAVVFFWKGSAGEELAVRFFTKPIDHRDELRYIATRLLTADSPYFVSFEYVNYGLWTSLMQKPVIVYPVVIMERAQGIHLDEYIQKNLESHEKLLALAKEWYSLVEYLLASNIAHGDLQHGNIIVTDSGKMKLVDYDGIYAKPIAPLGSQECGHPNYNHPVRKNEHFGPRMDVFSSLVISISILASAYDPQYWHKYHKEESLIFNTQDFKDTDKSEVFSALISCESEFIRDLAIILKSYCKENNPLCGSHFTLPPVTQSTVDKILRKYKTPIRTTPSVSTIQKVEQSQPKDLPRAQTPVPQAQQNIQSVSTIQNVTHYVTPQRVTPQMQSYPSPVYRAPHYVPPVQPQQVWDYTGYGYGPQVSESISQSEKNDKKGFIFGIISIILAIPIGIIIGPLAILYGFRARSIQNTKGTIAIILGLTGTILSIILYVIIAGFFVLRLW